MSNAAAHRLRRSHPFGQLALGALDEQLYPQPALEETPDGPDSAGSCDAAEDETTTQDAFARLSTQLADRFTTDADPWAGSPHAWLKRLPSARRGRAGTALVEQWARQAGVRIGASHASGHDLLAGDDTLRVKLSTLWESGEYTFQGVRDGDYDVLALLGISPHAAHLWIVPREDALEHSAGGWIALAAAAPPDWLAEHGGPLEAAKALALGRWCA